MNKISRRSLASYAAGQLLLGKPVKNVAKHLAAILVESGRDSELEFLIGDVAWELERRQALAIGRVTSARPLTRQLEAALKAAVKEITRAREVLLTNKIDKSVLGGLKVETAGRVWDETLSRKLANLRETF